ncbi:hypothetical protein CGRA01v4_13470 [Colletotrichum graminicola]|nr:hypothetical protein CGRA01v4_13470 [Colletotrichum graminicola]
MSRKQQSLSLLLPMDRQVPCRPSR